MQNPMPSAPTYPVPMAEPLLPRNSTNPRHPSYNSTFRAIQNTIYVLTGEDIEADELMENWGAAVLLSDLEEPQEFYTYNHGGASSSESGGVGFNLGAINLYNYSLENRTWSLPNTDPISIGEPPFRLIPGFPPQATPTTWPPRKLQAFWTTTLLCLRE
jgi:hypothetical protein